MRLFALLLLAAPVVTAQTLPAPSLPGPAPPALRLNLAGYRADDAKHLLVVAEAPLSRRAAFTVTDEAGRTVLRGPAVPVDDARWGGPVRPVATLDASALRTAGRYVVRVDGLAPDTLRIGPYPAYQHDVVAFLRQQRCGYNPLLDAVCHAEDGRAVDGPRPFGSYLPALGGWHDAGDQLQYLITTSNATARLLLAYGLAPDRFGPDTSGDAVNDLGQPGPNGVPDVLDEARWGLEWILRLHPTPGELYHQVADDRDHRGFRLPANDSVDYGWGPGKARPVYFATGAPQGLGRFKSDATGIANLAGRSAAAMALGAEAFDALDPVFAERCRRAARSLYALGRAQEGYQQGNSYGAPYRYMEDTWADDMEWAAAELFRTTGEAVFHDHAVRYARIAGTTSWMERDSVEHYRFYPFMNVGHFALHRATQDAALKAELAGYYRDGLERIARRAATNPYGVGVPFVWCSNHLVGATVYQAWLYRRMTGDGRFDRLMTEHRDWLLGRNPWRTSMFMGLPYGAESPEDVHLPVTTLRPDLPLRGGLVDGPVWGTIYRSLLGIRLGAPDEFAAVQPSYVVYHDDMGDYSTNEPTMDGTADALWMFAAMNAPE